MTLNKKLTEAQIDTSTLPEGERCLTCEGREECGAYLSAIGLEDIQPESGFIEFAKKLLLDQDREVFMDQDEPLPQDEAIKAYLDKNIPQDDRFVDLSMRHIQAAYKDFRGNHMLLRFSNNYGLHLVHSRNEIFSVGVVAFYDHLVPEFDPILDDRSRMWQVIIEPEGMKNLEGTGFEETIEHALLLSTQVPYLAPVDLSVQFVGVVHPNLPKFDTQERNSQ